MMLNVLVACYDFAATLIQHYFLLCMPQEGMLYGTVLFFLRL